MSFNQDSNMPEYTQGHVEDAIKTEQPEGSTSPSVRSTDRYGLNKAGKSWLLRKYDIRVSEETRLPYFAPVESMLKEYVRDAQDILARARKTYDLDTKAQKRAKKIAAAGLKYFEAHLEDLPAERHWLARSMVVWPLTNQVGYQLYRAASGTADLVDFGTYLVRTDADINSVADLDHNIAYTKRKFWTDVAIDELGVVDAIIEIIDPESLDYALSAIIRAGYRTAAKLDTREHLAGVKANAPTTSDVKSEDIKAQIMASLRMTG